MMSWWKIGGLGLLVSGIAAACTVTSGDDDDTTPGTTGGTTSGGAGTGGTGTAGSTNTGGTAGTNATDPTCFTCLQTNCAAADWATCGDTCKTELSRIRACACRLEQQGQVWGTDVQDACVAELNTPDGLPSEGTNAMFNCVTNTTAAAQCETTCFDICY